MVLLIQLKQQQEFVNTVMEKPESQLILFVLRVEGRKEKKNTSDIEKSIPMKKIDPKAIEILKNGSQVERVYLCKKSILYFAIFYFAHYFKYPLAPFHFDFYSDLEKLFSNEIDEVAWIAFRESAKTSLAKIGILHAICYKEKEYINWDSYDKGNSESALFDIVVELQTNQRLIDDFGQLFYKKKHKDMLVEATRKRVGEFITENHIKVEAFSTQESTRGRVYGTIRPDMFVIDDFETVKTIVSYPVMGKIKAHINELKAGLGVNGSILYLGNYITEDGVVDHIIYGDEDTLGIKNNDRAILRMIPVAEEDGTINWKGKYVATDEEAAEFNKTIDDKDKRKISLRAKERSLGVRVFATEMMNNPQKAGDYYFDLDILRGLRKHCTKPKKISAGLKIWADFNAKHRYGGGADTSAGIGRDSNTIAIIDFSTRPAKIVLTYKNNQIKPNIFAWDLMRAGNKFGECFLVPEINNTGYATIAELIKPEDEGGCGYEEVYQREIKNKTTNEIQKEYGFNTNKATKPDVFGQFKSAIEDGELMILDKDLLEECEKYRDRDLHVMVPQEGMTHHFDLLMAAVLAW